MVNLQMSVLAAQTLQNNLRRSHFSYILLWLQEVVWSTLQDCMKLLWDVVDLIKVIHSSTHSSIYLIFVQVQFWQPTPFSIHFKYITHLSFLGWCHKCSSLSVEVLSITKWRIKNGQLKLKFIFMNQKVG